MGIEIVNIPRELDRYSDLNELVEASRDEPLKGYPKPGDRWHIPHGEWRKMSDDGILTVPDGRWAVRDHPARQQALDDDVEIDQIITPDNPMDPARTEAWRQEGLLVTDLGLPVHPLAEIGVTEFTDGSWLGMATDIGRERYYGPSKIGNIALKRLNSQREAEYSVVTTWRDNKTRTSFAGGYKGRDENIYDAAVREGQEETNIVAACADAGISWNQLEQLPSVFWRLSPSLTGPNTLNAWLDEHFLMIDATSIQEMQRVVLRANDSQEVRSAHWRRARDLIKDPTFMGAHRRALKAHIRYGA